ncbi:MAG: aminoacetone oxidase family FAD-binding enzyme [Gammaproteobacteria bacterium]|jgi:predicted Rossmann fold flavoprotein|nr:aminoacetone oxidase family FAD-binding enzyme [Gammaproteobacteria bacterium]
MEHADVIIIGGGAAGLMCAIAAGQRGRQVVVLEGSNKIGKKILMSGGGRCNFTNIHTEPSRFISANPHFCKSALSRYTQWDFIALVEKHGIAYHEKSLGQLFCDTSSKEIVAMLAKECDEAGVRILTDCTKLSVTNDTGYTVKCSRGTFKSESLVVASGGLSIPKMGASDFGYRLARQFSLRVLDTAAGLVPFTLTGALHELSNRLSGVSCNATVTVADTQFTEDLLFTHRGLSGPVMLQASSYWLPGDDITIDLLPGVDVAGVLLEAKASRAKSLLRVVLADLLPKALIIELQALFWPSINNVPLAEVADDRLGEIADKLQSWSIKPAATEGYRTAEVTLGGVDTDEISSKTMESKQHPGLFFIGEVVDVTGHLGGFNFQWAWSSGQAAGQVV